MLTLGEAQQPVVMPSYPHMLHADCQVWTKFLESEFIEMTAVWYDVHVGKPLYVGAESAEMLKQIALGVTRKRIDVVGKVGGGYWVIEVKPIASMQAIGQVLTYVRLLVREYRLDGDVMPVIVCNEVDEDVVDEIDELGVMVIRN